MPTGNRRWHIEPEAFTGDLHRIFKTPLDSGLVVAPRDFNPYSAGRCALTGAKSQAAACYAGTTPACALWETMPFRSIAGTGQPGVYLPTRSFERLYLTTLTPITPLWLVDCSPLGLRRLLLTERAVETAITFMAHKNKSASQRFADQLVRQAAREGIQVDGLRWRSRQCDGDVILLYQPPVAEAALRVLAAPISLQTHPHADALIDAALAEGKRFRIKPAGLDPCEDDDS